MVDIDGRHARDLIAPLFFNYNTVSNTDLHCLIRKRLILPYLTGSFHPSLIEEYAGGLLMALQERRWWPSPYPLRGDLQRDLASLLRQSRRKCNSSPQ